MIINAKEARAITDQVALERESAMIKKACEVFENHIAGKIAKAANSGQSFCGLYLTEYSHILDAIVYVCRTARVQGSCLWWLPLLHQLVTLRFQF